MNDRIQTQRQALLASAALAFFGSAGVAVQAQGVAQSETFNTRDPNPYYVGINQALTYDTNVYRIPFGTSDHYSTTSLFGGFDQRISRQRVFGTARVGLHRYLDETSLNNTSYAFAAGMDWETIHNLSGDIDLGLTQSLEPPPAGNAAAAAAAPPNNSQRQNVDLRARWGGRALLTLEGTLGYSQLRYSEAVYIASETNETRASLSLRYHPGGPLRLGVTARTLRLETPAAFLDPATGNFQASDLKSNTLEGSADYDATGQLKAGLRLGYTSQTSIGAGAGDAKFSGLTGGLNLRWQPTAKTSVRFDISRDAGFDEARYNMGTLILPDGTVAPGDVALLANSRVTATAGLGATYLATAKITATAGVRYQRDKLITTGTSLPGANTTETVQTGYIGATYAISRGWGLACNLSHETREVSGPFAYRYSADAISCSTQYVWR